MYLGLLVQKPYGTLTFTPFVEFSSRAVTTCFNDLGLSRLVFEHSTFNMPVERSYQLCHHRGLFPLILFVCLGFFVPLENFSLILRRHHYRRRAANFDLCSALMTIEQWGFFSVPHLLWHGACVYNGHLREPVTLTLISER